MSPRDCTEELPVEQPVQDAGVGSLPYSACVYCPFNLINLGRTSRLGAWPSNLINPGRGFSIIGASLRRSMLVVLRLIGRAIRVISDPINVFVRPPNWRRRSPLVMTPVRSGGGTLLSLCRRAVSSFK
jgi:hypothetical protein